MKKNQLDLKKITSSEEWDNKWIDIFQQYQTDLRHAYYINAIKNNDEDKLLEIAAGSFRDVAKLNKLGVDCTGIDFSKKSVDLAKEKFNDISNKIKYMDAFNLSYNNEEFDLTYHNGFWVLFSNNEIISLAKEQARITKKRIIATVHNAHNKNFVDYFKKLSKKDPLYNIRFFFSDEITELMKPIGKNISIIPVGKGKKFHEDMLINIKADKKTIRNYLYSSKQDLLMESERLMVIIDL